MTWFETLVGFPEASAERVRQNIAIEDGVMASRVNGRRMQCGVLETPSLRNLRERARSVDGIDGKIAIHEIVANVQDLHVDKTNAGALFQVASQFNLLEMVSPNVTPEDGISRYESDRTQGPSCAIAAGAGTIYRNYFAPVNGQQGQSSDKQIDCLIDLGSALGNQDNQLWEMRNGYALATRDGLISITNQIQACAEEELDRLRGLLKIGLQWNTEVTLYDTGQAVSQAYCSALPVGYSQVATDLWESFARLILEAAYEATICAGVINFEKTGSNKVFLTLLGGGVFGNRLEWIVAAISRALELYNDKGLDVVIVSYSRPNPALKALSG